MIAFNIPQNAVPVFMNFDTYTEADKCNNKEAMFRVNIADDEFIIRGDHEEIRQAASGLCHVFGADVNPNPEMPDDFIGMIQCAEDKKYPKGLVQITPAKWMGKPAARVFLKIGERSMSFGTPSMESARNYASGLAEFFGLVKKRKGEEYTGTLKFA